MLRKENWYLQSLSLGIVIDTVGELQSTKLLQGRLIWPEGSWDWYLIDSIMRPQQIWETQTPCMWSCSKSQTHDWPNSRNEAAWCYLEGFGGKKDKVSWILPITCSVLHGINITVLSRWHRTWFHETIFCTNDSIITRPKTTLQQNELRYDINPNHHKVHPAWTTPQDFTIEFSNHVTGTAPKYYQYTPDTANPDWKPHIGHQCINEWHASDTSRTTRTLH